MCFEGRGLVLLAIEEPRIINWTRGGCLRSDGDEGLPGQVRVRVRVRVSVRVSIMVRVRIRIRVRVGIKVRAEGLPGPEPI